nr:TetR family transcriptional regulator [Novosphingobium sp. BW1]
MAREGFRQQSLRELAKALEMEAQHVLYYFVSREDMVPAHPGHDFIRARQARVRREPAFSAL